MFDFQKADLVCSDAVPDFIGERFVDHMNSINLNNLVLTFCHKNLKKGGSLLMKIMQGPAEKDVAVYPLLINCKLGKSQSEL